MHAMICSKLFITEVRPACCMDLDPGLHNAPYFVYCYLCIELITGGPTTLLRRGHMVVRSARQVMMNSRNPFDMAAVQIPRIILSSYAGRAGLRRPCYASCLVSSQSSLKFAGRSVGQVCRASTLRLGGTAVCAQPSLNSRLSPGRLLCNVLVV